LIFGAELGVDVVWMTGRRNESGAGTIYASRQQGLATGSPEQLKLVEQRKLWVGNEYLSRTEVEQSNQATYVGLLLGARHKICIIRVLYDFARE
jgi:hypothetical protein